MNPRDKNGRPASLEIRADFLRDYLAARKMALRLAWYRQRIATVMERSIITWPDDVLIENTTDERFEGRCWPAIEGGMPLGADITVFKVWRTDVDPEKDIQKFQPSNDHNTDHASHSYSQKNERKVFIVEGEVWRNEWIEPAAQSIRLRGDDVPPTVFFITDVDGKRESRATLGHDDVGKYLWFRGGIVPTILQYRGSNLTWYTADTGRLELTKEYSVHFGVNSLGFLNVYAYDIAKLPDWQQQVWVGYNITPEGGVSTELLEAQMRANPASTRSPEDLFATALADLNRSFIASYGKAVLREHQSSSEILRAIHRFRATDRAGLLALAKDVTRLTADSIDTAGLNCIVAPSKNEKWGSLKSLEKVLESGNSTTDIRKLMTPLFKAYELRLGDAHLPSEKIESVLNELDIDQTKPTVFQGAHLLLKVAMSLHAITLIIEAFPNQKVR